ncbi:MAG: hypothetical protein ACFCU7_04220 [Pleurocapsa sp.]
MIKNILRLLAASTSFVALLLVTNSAIAATPQEKIQVELPHLTLNVISPSLQLVSQDSKNTLLDHLGCSCAVCTQGINQPQQQYL